MSLPVDLRQLMGELEAGFADFKVFLNRRTGATVAVSDEDLGLLESIEAGEEDEAALLEEADELAEIREALSSEDYLELPGKDELDEYGLMKSFALERENTKHADALLRAIQGEGAFRRFKDVAYALDLLQVWFDYRQRGLEDAVAEWLEGKRIPYTRER